jgi:hypothetical protein
MISNKWKAFMPVRVVFLLVAAFDWLGKSVLVQWNLDYLVLFAGNLLLYVITWVSFTLALRGVNNPNPHAFIRSVYSSIMIKLFACLIIAFIYIAINKAHLNKPAFFTCMGLYLVYTFMEVSVLMKLLKREKV